ncbi:hypothetical protein [Paractinoplanes lichenicola]|uniref:Uncharacterized protein n=1 Tax=Paractinoplanes lichenicola TaxID=2802976 RepID=A0ABS1W039_9ACTN|nr:hypothetical protein [Actinoplanes lichenicola]MBL7260099.1 hypothetical protein [Actinoplanes lichenicola]
MTSTPTEPAGRPAPSGWCAAALALLMADALQERGDRGAKRPGGADRPAARTGNDTLA